MAECQANRWARILVVAAAICGLLAMHGFEAALVHADHAGASGHVAGDESSPAEAHAQHGGCSLEKPGDQPAHPISPCPVDAFAPAVSSELSDMPSDSEPLANRAVLAAFSILRL